jgi:GTP cyclohydrolase I
MNEVQLTWGDVGLLAIKVACQLPSDRESCIYPIPRAGVFAALMVQSAASLQKKFVHLVDTPQEATAYVDDIIDSGNTRLRTCRVHGEKPFFALYEKVSPGWVHFPWDNAMGDTGPEENVRRLLQYIGDDPTREGLAETPARVVRSYAELFSGYSVDPGSVIKTFKEDSCDEMVVVKDVEFYSTCEHHMLPFFGKAHIAYIPNGRVVGVSKLVRLLEVFARRLQIQERLCEQVTAALDTSLQPKGSACVLEAKHLCMTGRGVGKQHSVMVTSSLTGVFKDSSSQARQEFLSMVR